MFDTCYFAHETDFLLELYGLDRNTLDQYWLALRCYRIARLCGFVGNDMPLRLTSLTNKAMKFRANLDAIGKQYDDGIDASDAHLSDMKSLNNDLGHLNEDLNAAVSITKNSVASLNDGVDKTAPVSLQVPVKPKSEESLSIVDQQGSSG